MLSSSGQVSSPQTIVLVASDQMTMSGLRAVITPVMAGKISLESRSSAIRQSLAPLSTDAESDS